LDNLIWIVVAAVVILAIAAALLPRGRSSSKPAPLPYDKQPYLLSRAERSFYDVLHRAVAPNLVVFPKVRLADVVKVRKGTESWQSHQNRINAKHIDFLVCTCDTLSPALVIELDDSSHERADRQERDALVDSVLASAGLPILHVPVRSQYNPAEIAEKVQATLLAR
jgi:very-short-patch-repair endonuclease